MKLNPNIISKINDFQNTIMTVLISFQLFVCITAVLFQFNNFIFNLAIFLISFLFFYFTKDLSQENDRVKILLKISIALFTVTLINTPISLFKGNGMDIPITLYFMVNILSIFIVFFIIKNEVINETLDSIISSDFKLFKKSEDKNNGDVEICKDLTTGKPVIIPRKDRYLHTLILGPTGSGKTSQIILPMLFQDMKNEDMGITVLEPKSDLAEKVYAMAKLEGRDCIYFNPIAPDCPYFNPLYGEEDEVIENMATTFNMLNADSQQYFKDMNEQLVRNSLKVLKRLYKNKATLIDLSRLIQNSGGTGREMVLKFSQLPSSSPEIAKENTDLASWFLNEYFQEKSKAYENTSGIRSQITKITSNSYLRRILNPPNGENDVDFDSHLAKGGVMAITTSQGTLRDLGKFLGYFIILQFQSAVFKRSGNENTRRDHVLFIDEFQSYSNPGFSDMLIQGRSYRVASHLATQNRALMGMGSGRDGKSFIDLVSTNARNIIIFPGGNAADADFYSKQFGEVERVNIQKGVTRKRFNPLYGFENIGYPSQTIRKSEKMESRFSPTNIMYRPFGEITYCIIQNNTLQTPNAGKVTFLAKEVARSVEEIVSEYNMKRFGSNNEQINDESIEDIEITFDDPIEPIIEDYLIKGKEELETENEEEILGIYDEPDNLVFHDEQIDDIKEKEDDSSADDMFEESRLFDEEIEENVDDNDSLLPIFGDEEDFLI